VAKKKKLLRLLHLLQLLLQLLLTLPLLLLPLQLLTHLLPSNGLLLSRLAPGTRKKTPPCGVFLWAFSSPL
jgi:hypothetical protein